jgi:hypothetical protein
MMIASHRQSTRKVFSRRSALEILERRDLMAAYTFNDAANTLSISLGSNENLTVSESAGTVSLALNTGTFTQSGGDAAPGSGTNTLSITSANLAGSLSVNNTTVADPGSNTVTFTGAGSLSLGTLTVTLTDPDADSDIAFDNGFDVASTSSISLTARRIVAVGSGSVVSNSGSGGIAISGNRQATQQISNSTGVVISGEVKTTGSGNISITGGGGTSGFLMPGVLLFANGKVTSTATGDSAGEIIIDGIGGTNPGSNVAGVYMDTNSLIQSVDGDIRIKGVSGNVDSVQGFGFYIPNTGTVESTGTGAGAAKITIDGTGLSNSGINMQGTGNIRSVDGAIKLVGEAPPTGPGIHFLSQTPVVTTGAAPVSLISNRINLDGGITTVSGAVSLTGKTSGRPIVIGSIGSTTELGLTDAGLDRIVTDHLRIGDSSSGNVTLAQEITRSTGVTFTSGTKIDVDSNITLIAAFDDGSVSPCDLTFDAPLLDIANGRILIADRSTIGVQGGTLNVGDSPGSFTAAGRLSLASNATYHAEIGGLTASVDYDHIIAQDRPTIDSATLDVDFSFTPAIGDSFLLVDNRSASAVVGAFKDLPEGAFFSADGIVFQITYAARPDFGGNDVVITRVTPPATASLVVNNTGDVNDGNYGAGQLTLREAILLSNLLSDQSAISFDATVFAGQKTVTLTGGQLPEIVQPVNITGTGANRLTIDAAGLSPHLRIAPAAGIVNLSGMNLVNGFTNDLPGGSIENFANLNLLAMMFEHNVVDGAPGGAIANSGTLTVTDSAFIANQSDNGGAIFNTGTLRVFNSTFSGNTAIESGGGLANFDTGTSLFFNCTIVGNSAGFQGGGIHSNQAIGLANTIVAGNTGVGGAPDDINGAATGANNLIGDAGTAGGLANGSDGNIVGINGVGVRPLDTIVEVTPASNGGPTKTHKLVANSKAIDAGLNASATNANNGPLLFDQRGTPFARKVNNTVDIGAYELETPPVAGAGNVTASVKNGSLKITGNAQGNAFQITQVDGDSYRIEGIDRTTINGRAFVVMDRVTKDWTIDLGRGADTMFLGAANSPVNVRGKLVIEAGDSSASDLIQLTRVTVQGNTTIETDSQRLTAKIVDAVFQGDFNLKTSAADDEVAVEGTQFRKKVKINLDGGSDLLTIRNTRFDSDTELNLARGTSDRADVGLPRSKASTPNSNGNTFKKTPNFAGVEVFL